MTLTKYSCRYFNSIYLSNGNVIKKSEKSLEGEIYYYLHIPKQVSNLFPKMLSYEKGMYSYTMEYVKGQNVSALFVDEKLTVPMFESILDSLQNIHSNVPNEHINNKEIYNNYSKKLIQRYSSHNYDQFDGTDSTVGYIYSLLLSSLDAYEDSNKGKIGMIHGDPVFTNIIHNSDTNSFKFIDMRGVLGDQLSVFGDTMYDWAKIYQSLIGYDSIIQNKTPSAEYIDKLTKIFFQKCPYKRRDVEVITSSMLFSLIPLHDEHTEKFYSMCVRLLK